MHVRLKTVTHCRFFSCEEQINVLCILKAAMAERIACPAAVPASLLLRVGCSSLGKHIAGLSAGLVGTFYTL